MKSKTQLVLWLLVCILFILSFIVFRDTFALFETNAEGDVDSDIGKWIIKINDNIITDTVNEDIEINNFIYDTSSKVENGYIAPGQSAYFDLVIDATDCDVAVLYSLSLNISSASYANNISFELEEVNGNSVVRTGEDEYSGIISLASINNDDTTTLRIRIFWEDLEAYNESDTALGQTIDSKITVPISFHASQYLGETLVEYTG